MRRREAYEAHAAALQRQREADLATARTLLAEFVAEMRRRGVRPERLRARVPDSATTYRTSVDGWYIRQNRLLGVSVDGQYYLLGTSRSLRSLILGAGLESSDPPLMVGVGARDGESIALEELLLKRLSWPDATCSRT